MDHKCFQTSYKDTMLKDLLSVSLKCSICFQWQLLYSHSLYNHVSQAQNGSNAAVSVPTGLFTDYVIIWLLLIMPIRQGDVSRIAGLDLLHIKVINNIMLAELYYKKVYFYSYCIVQTECMTNLWKKNCLSKNIVDLKIDNPFKTMFSLRCVCPFVNPSTDNLFLLIYFYV